jgi:AcrR family transcriptional regulator
MATSRARKSPARTPHAAAREAFRADLRVAAEAAFAAKGFQATRMQDIARAAGVAVGTLYNYFPSKEDIFEELCAVRSAAFHALVEQTARDLAPIERLEALVRASFEYLEQHGALFAVFVERGGKAEYDIERIGGRATEQGHARFLRLLGETMQAGVEAGELRADVPVTTMVAALSGAMNGATYAWLKRRRRGGLSPIASELMSLFLSGARRTR